MSTKVTPIACPRVNCKGNLEYVTGSEDEPHFKCTHCERTFSSEEIEKTKNPKRAYRPLSHWEMHRENMLLLYHEKGGGENGNRAVVTAFGVSSGSWWKLKKKWLAEGHLKQGPEDHEDPLKVIACPYPDFDDSWSDEVKIAWLQNWPWRNII